MTQWDQPLSGIRRVPVAHGETLQAIAARELGDAARWVDLAHLNGLRPPYLDTAAAPGVLAAGDLLMVPAAPPPGASGVTDPRGGVFGADLALPGGDLQATAGGDLEVAAGVPNLVQALRHRLRTQPGELPFHADYGCPVHELLGRRGSPAVNALAAAFVARSLRADPRIARTESASASLDGDTIRVAATAVTVDGRQIPVTG